MQFETWLKSDLKKPLSVIDLKGNFFTEDSGANLVGVELYDNGQPVTISGTITGYVIRQDGAMVPPITGTASGNKAQIILSGACYEIPGTISIVIKVGDTAIGACVGSVYRATSDSIVDPEHVIPSIEELLAQIEACQTATNAATAAAASANSAATAANNAATAANSAASAIQNLSSTATVGTTPGAVVNDVNGHKNIDFTFPVIIPDLTQHVTTNTLQPGNNASVVIDDQSPYSPEAPAITFNIPQGAPGSVDNVFGTTIPISPSDSTNIKAYVDAVQNAVIDAIYPVGSTYISMNSTMPAALTTGRTWEAITGGYALKTITTGAGGTYSNAGNTGSTALTVEQMPAHTHELNYGTGSAANGTGGAYNLYLSGGSSEATKSRGGSQGHTHTAGMPKNVSVYMWKRTA